MIIIDIFFVQISKKIERLKSKLEQERKEIKFQDAKILFY